MKSEDDNPNSRSKQTPCGRNFKAATEKDVMTQVIDTGLVAILCRCGVPLRLHNIRRTGEKLIYALRLLQSVLSDKSCPPMLILSYDIGCTFKKYVEASFQYSWFANFERIILVKSNSNE
jgi:hypothetical protein